MEDDGVTMFICTTCRGPDDPADRPGARLFDAVSIAMQARGARRVTVKPVECLSVCKHPGTIALAGENKWTYVIAGIGTEIAADDVVDAALQFAATADGIIPWRERPLWLRKGVVCRVPPLAIRSGR